MDLCLDWGSFSGFSLRSEVAETIFLKVDLCTGGGSFSALVQKISLSVSSHLCRAGCSSLGPHSRRLLWSSVSALGGGISLDALFQPRSGILFLDFYISGLKEFFLTFNYVLRHLCGNLS